MYTYQTPGTYNVCLSVTNSDGLSAEICSNLTVVPQSTGKPLLKVDDKDYSKKQQGQAFQLFGSGFTPYSVVTVFVWKDGGFHQIFEQKANERGEISWSWPSSSSTCEPPTGLYELQALDKNNGESNLIREEVTSNPACITSTPRPASEKLISPIAEYPDPYEAPVSSIYDHSGSPGDKDGIVRAFNGEEGSIGRREDVCKRSKDDNIRFLTDVINYVSYSRESLCYDGHYGIDFAVYNSTIVAALPGKVIKTHTDCPNEPKPDCGSGWGNYVVIQHTNSLQTLYAHLKNISVSEGTEVSQGQKIGISGNSGNSNGPHLHFGVCRQSTGICNTRNAAWVDPYAEGLWANSKLIKPRDKSLVRVKDKSEVFWIQNGKRYHVLGTDRVKIDILDAMKSLSGWGWDKVQIVSAEVLNQFALAGKFIALDQSSDGILIRQQGTKQVYVIEGGRPFHVRDESEFAARGFDWNDVIIVSADIMQLLNISPASVADWQQVLPEVAQRYGHDPKLIQAIIQVESKGNSKAESYRGARGLMQIMKETWEDTTRKLAKNWGWDEAFDPVKNIEVGCAYLNWLRNYLEKNRNKWRVPWPEIGLAAYNAGPGSVEKYNFDIPPFAETQKYVKLVMEKYNGSTADGIISPDQKTKTIEQAIASLVPNDPPDVAQPDAVIGDVEMTKALGYYEKQQPVPNTDGEIIDDATMLRLQDLWLSRRPVSSSSLRLITSETSLRREWGLLTRQLDRHSLEFIVLGFDVRSIRVEIFNLQGQRVFAEEAPNNRLTFRGQDSQGQRLANGVYLYVVTVRSHDGTIQRSSVRKLILQR
jgi:murein DD-endopeptidase MepM/ murein hydrolase activator NlpD/soluble lytic murein transglycosylase-like protein